MRMRLNAFVKISVLAISALLMVGCGWFRDRSEDYLKAESIAVIDVPPCTQAEPFSPEYLIPGR